MLSGSQCYFVGDCDALQPIIIGQNHAKCHLMLSRRDCRPSKLHKIEQDNCFIIQHIDNKAQFYCKKAGDDLYFSSFLPDT